MNHVAFMGQIGEAVLKTSIKETYYKYSPKAESYKKHNPYLVKAASQAVAFMSGTGLEAMIKYYNLDYDADVLRELLCRKYKVGSL